MSWTEAQRLASMEKGLRELVPGVISRALVNVTAGHHVCAGYVVLVTSRYQGTRPDGVHDLGHEVLVADVYVAVGEEPEPGQDPEFRVHMTRVAADGLRGRADNVNVRLLP